MDESHYFALRGVSPASYAAMDVPAYLRRILTSGPRPNVLDFGCGYGQLLDALVRSGIADAEGADIEPAAIAHCRSRGHRCLDLNAEGRFYEHRASSYDFVVMSHVLEHFPKQEIIPALRRIRTLLKPGGGLIVMVPNAQSHTGAYWAYEDFTHHLLFTAGSLRYVLQAAGFSAVEFLDPDCTEGLPGWKRLVKKLLLRGYEANYRFWNRATTSATHAGSPSIFSYEIKVHARV